MKKQVITCNRIRIKGPLPRQEIVKKVVNTFIDSEHLKKGKGIKFHYPVEDLPNGKLFIARPGRKKNFDFKVLVAPDMKLGTGSHNEIASDLRNKKQENPTRFKDLLHAIDTIHSCSESSVNLVLRRYPNLKTSFKTGAQVEVLLKVLKWMFIMEDVYYWDYQGRDMLYSGLKAILGNVGISSDKDDYDYIPLSEAAEITGYTIDHLRRLIQRDKMRGQRIGRNYVTTRSAVKDYLACSPKPGRKPKAKN